MFNKNPNAVGTQEVSDPLRQQFLAGLFVGAVLGIGMGGLLGILA